MKPDVAVLTKVSKTVAPHAGAWIETVQMAPKRVIIPSLPMRERGLKQIIDDEQEKSY